MPTVATVLVHMARDKLWVEVVARDRVSLQDTREPVAVRPHRDVFRSRLRFSSALSVPSPA